MKHKLMITCILLLALLLTACGQERQEVQSVYTVTVNDHPYTIDTQNLTVSDGMYTYHYKIIASGNRVSTTITYPNGATYHWTWSGNVGSGGWSEDYDDTVYADGHALLRALEQDPPGTRQKREYSGNPLLGLLFIGLGLWNAISPYSSWYLNYGWRYKNLEPSDAALGMTRLGGIVGVIVGVIVMIV